MQEEDDEEDYETNMSSQFTSASNRHYRKTSFSGTTKKRSPARQQQLFQSIENLPKIINQSRKNNLAQTISVSSIKTPKDKRLSMELKNELLKALNELNQDVKLLRSKKPFSLPLRQMFQRAVKKVIFRNTISKYREILYYMNLRYYAALRLQNYFRLKQKMQKCPYRVLKRVFGCRFVEGIYLGWKIRKSMRKEGVQKQIQLIRSLQPQIYNDYSSNSYIKTQLNKLKVQLIGMIQDNKALNLSSYKSNSEKLQKQLDISEEVLIHLETNKIFDNSKIYEYLNSFDSLLQNEDKLKSSLGEGTKPYSDKYETFHKRRNNFDTMAQTLRQQSEPSFQEQDIYSMKELDKFLIKSNPIYIEDNFNNFNTQSSQKFNESSDLHQNFVFDYQRFGGDLKDDQQFKNIQQYNQLNESREQYQGNEDSFNYKPRLIRFSDDTQVIYYDMQALPVQQTEQQILSSRKRLKSLRRQYCKSAHTFNRQQNLLKVNLQSSPKHQVHKHESAGKLFQPLNSSKICRDPILNDHSPSLKHQYSNKDNPLKTKRIKIIDNLNGLFDKVQSNKDATLDQSSHLRKQGISENEKEDMQIELEKIFMQLRGGTSLKHRKLLSLESPTHSPDISGRPQTVETSNSTRKRKLLPFASSAKNSKLRNGSPYTQVSTAHILSVKSSNKQFMSIPESNKATSKILQMMSNQIKRPQTGLTKNPKGGRNIDNRYSQEFLQQNSALGKSSSNKNLAVQSVRTSQTRPATSVTSKQGLSNRLQLYGKSRPQTAFYQSMVSTNQNQQQSLEYLSQSELPIDIKLATAQKHLAQKSTISNFTKEENKHVDSTIGHLTFFEKNIERKQSLAGLDKIDCKDKITKAFREIKCLNYQISKIVQKVGEGSADIPHKRPLDIEVMQETLMTFKAQVKGQPSPARFIIEYNEKVGNFKSDLKIYCSSHTKEPKESNCQKIFSNPTRFTIGSSTKSEFNNEFIYLSFYSLTGCSIILTVNFGDPNGGKSGKTPTGRGGKFDDDDDYLDEDKMRKRKEEEDKFDQIMRKQRQKQCAVDFIQKNMERAATEFDEVQKEKVFKIRTTWTRIENAKSRKQIIENEQRKKKIFMLHRWEILKEKRQELYEEKMLQRQEEWRKFELIKCLKTIQMMKHVFIIFDQKREVAVREAKTTFAVNMFAIRFRRWQKRKRLTFDERNQQIAKKQIKSIVNFDYSIFTIHSSALFDIKSHQGGQILKSFLEETSVVYDLKQKMRNFYKKMLCIQNASRQHKIAFANRNLHLNKVLFEKERQFLVKQCMGKKVSRQKQDIFKRINPINDLIKEAVIKVYMKRCVTVFQLRFLEWRLDFKLSSAPEKIRDRELDKIGKKKKTIEALDKLLFLGVLLPDEAPPLPPQPLSPPLKDQKPKPARGKGKQEVIPIEPPKPIITPIQKIQKMLTFNKDGGDDDIGEQVPFLRFIPIISYEQEYIAKVARISIIKIIKSNLIQEEDENQADSEQLNMSRIILELWDQTVMVLNNDVDDEDEDEDMLDIESGDGDSDSGIRSIITLNSDLPYEWKEIEEDESEIAGPLAVLLFKRLSKLKLFTGLNSGTLQFLKPVLDYYEIYSRKSQTDVQAAKNIQQLLEIVPSLKQIRQGMYFRESKENIVYKIVLDVLGHYLKEFDGPSFKTYKKKLLPTAIEFYETISDDEMQKVNETLKQITNNEICKYPYCHQLNIVEKLLMFKQERKEYIQFYEKELMSLNNQSAGNSKKKYLM